MVNYLNVYGRSSAKSAVGAEFSALHERLRREEDK